MSVKGTSLDIAALKKLARFLAVGGSSALAYGLACTALVHVFPESRAAVSVGVHACLIPPAYLGQRWFTFRSAGNAVAEFLKYTALQLVSIVSSTWLLIHLVTGSPLADLTVFLLIAATAAVISFAICNALVFVSPSAESGGPINRRTRTRPISGLPGPMAGSRDCRGGN